MYYYYYYYGDFYSGEPDFSTFSKRVFYVLGNRKLHPWCATLGLSKGAADSIRADVIPGPGILLGIHRQERVNISWLLSGEGKPFIIDRVDTEQAFLDLFSKAMARPDGYDPKADTWARKIYLCHDKKRLLIAIAKPNATYIHRTRKNETEVKYTKWALIHGPFSEALFRLIADQFSLTKSMKSVEWFVSAMPQDAMGSMISGEYGPVVQFGDGKKQPPKASIVPVTDIEVELQPLRETLHQRVVVKEMVYNQGGSIDLMTDVAKRLELHRNMSGDLMQFEERWRVYKHIYDYCARKGVAPNEIDDSTISNFLEVLL
ncbi:hypothetical protein [uncultured Endozoicomonas sp.]|uniref:hypothetical protein n=1 Tax=uncultured Endozoicomonas sp. TaxID=432652 RepID=UPI0026019E20|nr:hypothetical protein [uncultured Endozoicomonas sp.]